MEISLLRNSSLQILFKRPTPAIVFAKATKPSRFAHFGQVAESIVPAMRNHIQRQKLTSKSASRHSSVNISSSKHGPNVWYFYYFDLKTCFAPQPHALFEHLNFQKCSEAEVFFPLLTSKCTSRHSRVHFFQQLNAHKCSEADHVQHFDLEMCFAPQPRARAQLPKVPRK